MHLLLIQCCKLIPTFILKLYLHFIISSLFICILIIDYHDSGLAGPVVSFNEQWILVCSLVE